MTQKVGQGLSGVAEKFVANLESFYVTNTTNLWYVVSCNMYNKVKCKIAGIGAVNNGNGWAFCFEAIYESNDRSLFRDHFRMSMHAFDLLFGRCSQYIPTTIRDPR